MDNTEKMLRRYGVMKSVRFDSLRHLIIQRLCSVSCLDDADIRLFSPFLWSVKPQSR